MAKEVFDQARPKSTKAQLFADAFAGCDEWVVPPRKPRQSTQADAPAARAAAKPALRAPGKPAPASADTEEWTEF